MIGELDQRVTIQREARTADDYGGAALAWVNVATVWANVRPLSGRERADFGEVEAPANYRFTIRRRGDITAAMRITWAGAAYNIRFVSDSGARSLYMALEAERGVAI